jgi:ribosomal protein L22
MREVAHTIKGMKVVKAKAFLNDVLQFKRAVPFTRCVTVLGLSCFTIHVWGSF